MAGFEYLFAFYSLLLGLALANAATGFADIWRSRAETPVGTLVPLMCGVVVTFVASQWMAGWTGKESFSTTPWMILSVMGICLPYVFASQAMIPKRPENWPDLDAYFLANAGTILGAILIVPVIAIGTNLFFGLELAVEPFLRIFFTLVVPAILVWRRRLWLHRTGLAAMFVFNVFRLFNQA